MVDASFLHNVAIRCFSTMADLQEESTLKVLLSFEPKLSKSENIAYIKTAFKELGKEYDLTFDDYDDKELYCTEFINNCLQPFGISFKQHSDYLNRTITLPNDMVNSIVNDYMGDQISYKLCIRKEADTIKSLGINEVIQFPQDHWMN
jgi:hypothetical protein